MKLIKVLCYLILFAIAASGCSTEHSYRGENYSTGMTGESLSHRTNSSLTGANYNDLLAGKGTQNFTDSKLSQQDSTNAEQSTKQVDNTGTESIKDGAAIERDSAVPLAAGEVKRKNVAKGVFLGKENIGGMSDAELMQNLIRVAKKTDTVARNAYIDPKTWYLKKEKPGRKLNIEKIKKDAFSARPGENIKYSYTSIMPQVTAKQLSGGTRVVGKYSTRLLDRSTSRVKNLRLGAKKLNYKIIYPGEEFSFNNTTGRISKRKGYGKATIIVKTPKGPKRKKATGGGVCQLSTTIYNAAVRCGLKITERHKHSDDVHYVPKGKDATVMYNGADLKFVNNRRYPIMIRIYVRNKAVLVNILERTGGLPAIST